MIRGDADRAVYLRGVISLLDGLPMLMNAGRPDQVQLELVRIRADVSAVIHSLDRPAPHVYLVDGRLGTGLEAS